VSTLWAGEAILREQKSFLFGKKRVAFVEKRDENIVISRGCEAGSCDARRALEKVRIQSLSQASGGAEPGAILCQEVDGQVVKGSDARGNQASFCEFRDKSMVSTGSLYVRALRHFTGRQK